MTEQQHEPQDTPQLTPEQAAALRERWAAEIRADLLREQAEPAPPPESHVGAAAAAAGAVPQEADVEQLMAAIGQLNARLAQLEAERAAEHAPALVSAAESLLSLVTTHLTGITVGQAVTGAEAVVRLCEDLVDAARNAVRSGDVTHVRAIAARVEKWLGQHHPGGGDHHYFRQAQQFAEYHIPGAADQVTGPQPQYVQVGGGKPAPVVAGS